MDPKRARPWFAATYELVVIELEITSIVAADNTGGHFHSPGARASTAGALPIPHGDRPLPDILEDLERQLIQQAYEKAGKVKTETARLLGIKTSALYYKLEKYGFIQKGEGEGEG